ncbi:hypothetical protein [Egbenema bharatensis]|uniref:hypothetical protein n=1 Tax=Egbenema bharatensis TaxID=3463334 RepID=UPI003A89CDE6
MEDGLQQWQAAIVRWGSRLLLGGLALGIMPSLPVTSFAGESLPQRDRGTIASSETQRTMETQYIRPLMQCPNELEELLPLLLRDLPSYANRVNQRAYPLDWRTQNNIPGYVLLVDRPELEPLPLVSREYTPLREDDTTQIFFTTLERQYVPNTSVRLQHHHWAFLTQTTRGWRLVFLFSAIGNVPANEPSTPPQDSSQGVIAQAMRLWLRDCQAGSIQPL